MWVRLMTVLVGTIFKESWLKWALRANGLIGWWCMCPSSITRSLWIMRKKFNVRRFGPSAGSPSLTLPLHHVYGRSILIKNAERSGHIHGIKICRRAPIVTHLLFADDSFLFMRANENEVNHDSFLMLKSLGCESHLE